MQHAFATTTALGTTTLTMIDVPMSPTPRVFSTSSQSLNYRQSSIALDML